MAMDWGITYKLKTMFHTLNTVPIEDIRAHTNQAISDVQQKAIDHQDASKQQLLPKDLLKDAVRVGKDEIGKAIVAVIKKKPGYPMRPHPLFAGGTSSPWGGTTISMPNTWDISTTVGTFTAAASTTVAGVNLMAGDSLQFTQNTHQSNGA